MPIFHRKSLYYSQNIFSKEHVVSWWVSSQKARNELFFLPCGVTRWVLLRVLCQCSVTALAATSLLLWEASEAKAYDMVMMRIQCLHSFSSKGITAIHLISFSPYVTTSLFALYISKTLNLKVWQSWAPLNLHTKLAGATLH